MKFHCTAVNAREIDWCVDGHFHDDALFRARNITTEINLTARNESNLTISSTIENNNTHIHCLAYSDVENYTTSNVSTFYVQGELANLTVV